MDLSDEALIDTFRKTKDASQFRALVGRYQNRIYSAAFRMLGTTEEAEEVVQETYIKVHQNIDRFRQQSSFGAWIFRIAHNISIDILRARKRRKDFQALSFDPHSVMEHDEYSDGAGYVVSQLADDKPCPEAQLDMTEQMEMIEASLKELPDVQREVVVLHDIEGFQYGEIAEIIGANIGTVRSRLHYGRLKLRQLLEPYFSSLPIFPAAR